MTAPRKKRGADFMPFPIESNVPLWPKAPTSRPLSPISLTLERLLVGQSFQVPIE